MKVLVPLCLTLIIYQQKMKNDKTSSNFAVAKNGGTFPANIIHCHFDSIACHKLVFASHWVFASLQFEDVIWTTPTEVLGVLRVINICGLWRLFGPLQQRFREYSQ